MGRISFKEHGEEHNFWQNYTDLMSGFLIVFIITSLVAYCSYQAYVDIFEKNSNGKVTPQDVIVNAELYKRIRDFQEVAKELGERSKYFHYNEEFRRFECALDVQFDSGDATIKPEYKKGLMRKSPWLRLSQRSWRSGKRMKKSSYLCAWKTNQHQYTRQ